MKKIIFILVIFFCIAGSVFSETLDKAWIIERNTGSVSTMQQLENPSVQPGDVLHVLLSAENLQAKWGEGSVQWQYAYETENGKTIWTSEFIPHKENVSGSVWDFLQVMNITVPQNIPEGKYKLGFTVIDYHSKDTYRGWVDFIVGEKEGTAAASATESEPAADTGPDKPASQSEYTVWIEDVELKLTAVEKNSNRLTFRFTGTNHGDEELKLRVYSYTTRIIDGNGVEYTFNDTDGSGKLSTSTTFPPGIPMQTDIYFRKPATNADSIALLYIEFYYVDDVLELRSIPIPWP